MFRKLAVLLLTLVMAAAAARGALGADFSRPGDRLTVVFEVAANPNGAAAVQLQLKYDHEALELVSADLRFEEDRGILMSPDGGPIAPGQLVRAFFRVRDGAKNGDYTISAEAVEAFDRDFELTSGLLMQPVSIRIAAGLAPVTGLTVGDITEDAVTLTWTASADADHYQVLYGETAIGALRRYDDAYGTGVRITGLSPDTEYAFAVRAVSDRWDLTSEPAGAKARTLGPAAPKITGLRAEEVTPLSVTVAWDSGPADCVTVSLRESGGGAWTDQTAAGADGRCVIAGLRPDTDYDVRVTPCAGGEAALGHARTDSLRAGGVVPFGRYEQDGDAADGEEPVEWLVLSAEGGRALLLSRYGLDAIPFQQRFDAAADWEPSSLREWLNGRFLERAFTEAERRLIMTTAVDNGAGQHYRYYASVSGGETRDRLFLLSYMEVEVWLDEGQRRCAPTAYAVDRGASATGGFGWWWLRSPGEDLYHAAGVSPGGVRGSFPAGGGTLCVRPALWLQWDETGRNGG